MKKQNPEEEPTTQTAFRLPESHKRALDMVAADMGRGTTTSSLLRKAVEEIIAQHRNGIFFDIAVRDIAQKRSRRRQ